MTLRSLESFAGHAVVAEVVSANINSPRNAFNAQNDAHDYFDQLAWGIEAQQQPGGEVSHLVFSIDPILEFSFNSGDISTVRSARNTHIQLSTMMEMKSRLVRGRTVV